MKLSETTLQRARRILLAGLDLLILAYLVVVIWVALVGGFTIALGPLEIRAHGYTKPLFGLTGVLLLRLWLRGSPTGVSGLTDFPIDLVTWSRSLVESSFHRFQSERRFRACVLLSVLLTTAVVGLVALTPYLAHGLTRRYFDNSEWSGRPATTGRDRVLRLRGTGIPWYGSFYSVEWTGVIYVPAGGDYRFALTSDDGSRLWIDDVLVVDNGGVHAAVRAEGVASLLGGFHRIRIRYMQHEGDVAFSTSWRREQPGGGGVLDEVPLAAAFLFPRQPGPAAFALYRVGRGLLAARKAGLWIVLTGAFLGGVWLVTMGRSGLGLFSPARHLVRRWSVRALLIFGSLTVALVTVEGALRVVYRDNGRSTYNGPGSQPLSYTFPPWSSDGGTRGPRADGLKPTGVIRILIQGDSITWGVGVSDWTKLYPTRLLEKLRRRGPHDMTVLARPGQGIDGHLLQLERVGKPLAPDIIVYQWYVNDMEAGRRPSFEGGWRQWRHHDALRRSSFLYWFLDYRATGMVSGYRYLDYMRHLFRDGSPDWHRFRTQFHRWATRATANADRVIMLQYPWLPFRGEYPLADLQRRLATAAGTSVWSQPAYAASSSVGTNERAPGSRYGRVRRGAKGVSGELAAFHDLPFSRGEYEVTFQVRLTDQTADPVAVLEVSRANGERLAMRRIRADDFSSLAEWQGFTLHFIVKHQLVEDVAFRITTLGRGGIEVDTVDLVTDYGIEVIDLIPYLQDFDTRASPFDAHPNTRAHGVLADVLFEQITGIASSAP